VFMRFGYVKRGYGALKPRQTRNSVFLHTDLADVDECDRARETDIDMMFSADFTSCVLRRVGLRIKSGEKKELTFHGRPFHH